jgi:uncharacterized protein
MHEIIWIDRKNLMRSKLADKPLYVALPDTGLVSLITATHIIQSQGATLLGFLDADWIPPITLVTKGDPSPPIKIYSTDTLNIFLSETPLPPSLWRLYAQVTYQTLTHLSSTLIISGTGIPNPKRLDIQSIDELRVFYLGKYLETEGINQEIRDKYNTSEKFTGSLAGPYSSIINYLIRENTPFITILVDSYLDYPDPESAAKLILELNSLLNINIDINKLLEKGSEIRLMARQLAIQTRRQNILSGQKTGSPPVGIYI